MTLAYVNGLVGAAVAAAAAVDDGDLARDLVLEREVVRRGEVVAHVCTCGWPGTTDTVGACGASPRRMWVVPLTRARLIR